MNHLQKKEEEEKTELLIIGEDSKMIFWAQTKRNQFVKKKNESLFLFIQAVLYAPVVPLQRIL